MLKEAPLAERMRPTTLEEFMGQHHLVGENKVFSRMVANGKIPSLVLWGPPGVGKTTLANILAVTTKRPFSAISAVQSGVKDVRQVLDTAKRQPGTILFIDEIHRFNKAQQDALLQAVEHGLITLIGATTENPSFEVIPALLSRCQVYILEALTQPQIEQLLQNAIQKDEILQKYDIRLEEIDAIYQISGGDARKALNLLELTVLSTTDSPVFINNANVMANAMQKLALYDKDGEQHYDIISAFIKSMRGGDPNAAVYWLARMLEGGENIRFIARRMMILASEDVGNANPNALLLATSCFQAIDVIGMPEARILLAQTATYLACSPKSNAAYFAIEKALEHVKSHPPLPVPIHLRNAPTKLMKDIGYGANYKYSHDLPWDDSSQTYLPEAINGTIFYTPKPISREKEMLAYLKEKWKDIYHY